MASPAVNCVTKKRPATKARVVATQKAKKGKNVKKASAISVTKPGKNKKQTRADLLKMLEEMKSDEEASDADVEVEVENAVDKKSEVISDDDDSLEDDDNDVTKDTAMVNKGVGADTTGNVLTVVAANGVPEVVVNQSDIATTTSEASCSLQSQIDTFRWSILSPDYTWVSRQSCLKMRGDMICEALMDC
jgi:hypothetical protein